MVSIRFFAPALRVAISISGALLPLPCSFSAS